MSDLLKKATRWVPMSVGLLVLAISASFSPASARADTWSSVAPMAEPRAAQTATLLPDGEVLVAGGYNAGEPGVTTTPRSLAFAQLFDPSVRSWVQAAPMHMARDGAKAALLADGDVLVVGGNCPFLQYDSETSEWICDSSGTAEAYDPSTNAWNSVAAPPELQSAGTLTALAGGRALLVGRFGPSSSDATAGAAVYDAGRNTWSTVASPLTLRANATATLTNNGDVLVVGGSYGERVLESAEEYDPETNEWTMLAPMHQPRTNQTATLLQDGLVLVAGGDEKIEADAPLTLPPDVLASVEAYDPATNSWQAIVSMNRARTFQTATTLPDGDVLMVGGQECNPESGEACLGNGDPPSSGDCCAASSAEVYEPASEHWTFTTPVTTGMRHTATLLQDGEVLVTGGEIFFGSGVLDSSYLYGPVPQLPPQPIQSPDIASPLALKFTHLRQSHRTWREVRDVGSSVGRRRAARRKRAIPVGTDFAFRLNEPADVRLTFTQSLPGRRFGARCLASRRHASVHPSCVRKRSRGTLEVAAHAGANRVAFRGSLPHGGLLPSGHYSVRAMAHTPGSHSPAKTRDFTIAR